MLSEGKVAVTGLFLLNDGLSLISYINILCIKEFNYIQTTIPHYCFMTYTVTKLEQGEPLTLHCLQNENRVWQQHPEYKHRVSAKI